MMEDDTKKLSERLAEYTTWFLFGCFIFMATIIIGKVAWWILQW